MTYINLIAPYPLKIQAFSYETLFETLSSINALKTKKVEYFIILIINTNSQHYFATIIDI